MDLRGHAEASGRVGADARHVPFASEIEDVAQQHQHAIGGPGGVAVGAHTVDQLGDALATDLVECEVTQGWQDVDSQDGFVRMPAPLGSLGVRQIPLADERASVGVNRNSWRRACGSAPSKASATTERPLRRACSTESTLAAPIFELMLPTARIDVSLIEGLATGGADFKQEASLIRVEEIDLLAAGWACRIARQFCRDGCAALCTHSAGNGVPPSGTSRGDAN